ncbi:radical SAM/SPASM domain-containing protein [Chloroflexota bacterium]
MKAKLKPRINLENRTRLEKVIPLSMPMILFVDPSSVCNFRCRFCPTGDHKLIKESGRWQGLMDFNLYKKVIDDLKEFNGQLKVLRLYKDGEPLLNDNLADMVHYARESGIVDYIDTTTNGYLLEPERIKPILDAGLDKINISVDGMSDEQFLEFTGAKVSFKKYVENIRHLYKIKGNCEIVIKTTGDSMNEAEKELFFDTFGNFADRIFIENVVPCWPEFEIKGVEVNQEASIYGQQIKEVLVCPYVFYSLSINSDGSASACFLDWSRKIIIGNVKTESVTNIWKGSRLLNYQKIFLMGKRKEHAVCGNCGQMSHGQPDDIDRYAEMLLERLRIK